MNYAYRKHYKIEEHLFFKLSFMLALPILCMENEFDYYAFNSKRLTRFGYKILRLVIIGYILG